MKKLCSETLSYIAKTMFMININELKGFNLFRKALTKYLHLDENVDQKMNFL